MKFKPWDHQTNIYNKTLQKISQGFKSILITVPTRGGKSWVATQLIKKYSIDFKMPVYFVAHTKILIKQMSDELTEAKIRHGIIAPWAPQIKYRVQVISKDSLFIRLNKLKNQRWKEPAIIIIDEAHMAMSKRYREIINEYNGSILIGLTATPLRLDGKSLSEIFDTIIVGPSIPELQYRKILCNINHNYAEFNDEGIRKAHGDYNKHDVILRVDKPKILKDTVHHWESTAKNKQTLTFCASIDHAEHIAECFNEKGYPSVAISSKDSLSVINNKVKNFYSGKYINLCSVNLFIMGFTVKDCECVLQARPTMSLMIYLQTLGRGMMYKNGKMLINIDAVNNHKWHDWPDVERLWSLDDKTNGQIKQSKYKRCPDCLQPVPVHARVCKNLIPPDFVEVCGHQWTESLIIGGRRPEEKEGELVQINSVDWNKWNNVMDSVKNV